MAISTAALERLGIHVAPETVEGLVLEALERVLSGRRAVDSAHELSPAEAAALVQGGLRLEPVDWGDEDPLLRTAAEYGALLATSLTVPEAARRLGVDASRIRHRLAARTIYGIRAAGGWRVPVFQLEGDRLLPGLERVLPGLDPNMHPVEVWRWLTTPNVDLTYGPEDTPLSPREWLRLGFDSSLVARLAADL